jgi:hypothetical protein
MTMQLQCLPETRSRKRIVQGYIKIACILTASIITLLLVQQHMSPTSGLQPSFLLKEQRRLIVYQEHRRPLKSESNTQLLEMTPVASILFEITNRDSHFR